VPSLYLLERGVGSVFSNGLVSAVVLNIGGRSTVCQAVWDGEVVYNATTSLKFGGENLVDYMTKCLTEKGYSFTTTAERDIVRDMKEKLCYVSSDFENELTKVIQLEKSYELPDSQVFYLSFYFSFFFFLFFSFFFLVTLSFNFFFPFHLLF
jgi:actin-related protein